MTHTASTASTTTASADTARTNPSKATFFRKGLPLLTMVTLVLLGGCGHAASTTSNTTEGSSSQVSDTAVSSVSLVSHRASHHAPHHISHHTERLTSAPVTNDVPVREYGLRPLTEDELTEYQDHTYSLLSEHSFHLTYADINEANFIAASTDENGLSNLHLYVSVPQGDSYTLPAHHEGHYMTDLKAVSFKQLNELNDSPDIIVIAEYITGIGPTGTVPFPVTTVYHYEGNGQYSKDESLSEVLTNRRVETIEDAMTQINSLDEQIS